MQHVHNIEFYNNKPESGTFTANSGSLGRFSFTKFLRVLGTDSLTEPVLVEEINAGFLVLVDILIADGVGDLTGVLVGTAET